MDLLDWTPNGRLGYAASAFVVYGLGLFACGAAVAVLVARWWAHRRRLAVAEQELSVRNQLALGHAVLTGTVALNDAEPAVRIAIVQQGREWKTKNGWAHEWREIERSITVRPFCLELPSGQSVRVVPDEDVRLVDALDETKGDGTMRRVRVATLAAGEVITATGRLVRERAAGGGGGYRDSGSAFVLRGVRGEPLLLSTSPLTEPAERWSRFYGWSAVLAVVVLAFLHGVVFLSFHRLVASGEVVAADVQSHRTYTTRSKNTTTTHYEITACAFDPSGAEHVFVDEVSYSAYARVVAGESNAPFLVAGGDFSTYRVGIEPQIEGGALVAWLLVTGTFVVVLLVRRKRKKAWFENEKVIDGGSGRLVPPPA
jgi:hypothetical protein